MEASTITHEGVTIRSNEGQTPDQLLAELSIEAPDPSKETPTETPAGDETSEKELPKAAKSDRNADGTFKPKEAAQPAKAKKDPQERIDRITWEREEAKREAAALRERIAALERQSPPPQPKPQAQPVTVDQVIERPDITKAMLKANEFFQQFPQAEYEAYTLYTARYAAQHAVAVDRLQSQQQSAQQAQFHAMASVEQAAEKAHPDFQEVAGAALAQGIRFTPNIAAFILQHPLGHDVAYDLLKQPDELRRLSSLPPLAAAVELGRLVSRLEAAPVTGSAPKTPPISKASPPPKPVGSSPAASDEPPGDDASDAEHDAYWAKQRRKYR